MTNVKQSKDQLAQIELNKLKEMVEKDSWIALKQYFDGKGNGPEAKIAVVTLGTLAKERQTLNGSRQLDLVEAKLGKTKQLGN